MDTRLIVADYVEHYEGQREVVDWTRPDGVTYRDVPVVYLRRVTEAEYRASSPRHATVDCTGREHFWEVSVD